MNKRYVHHLLKRLQRFRLAYLIVAVIVSGGVFIGAYRHNNIVALQLRDKVQTVDKDNGDVESVLQELRSYTYSHMNAGLDSGGNSIYPPIQLKYHYERLVAAERQRVEAANSHLYTEAQAYCEHLMPTGVSRDRVPCIQNYVTTHNPAVAQPVPDALYKFNFTAPLWSPDLAGWSLFVTGVLLVVLIIRIGLAQWLRYRLHDA